MKKTYQKPEIELVLVAQTLLQSGSPQTTADPDPEAGVDPGDFEVKDSKLFGGGSSIWDNEGWDE